MSLFDVIRYGNIDLSSITELITVPKPILNEYFDAVRQPWNARGSNFTIGELSYILKREFLKYSNNNPHQLFLINKFQEAIREYEE